MRAAVTPLSGFATALQDAAANIRALLHHGLAGFVPVVHAAVEVIDFSEAEFLQGGEGAGAATTGLTVDENGLGFVQRAELGGEVCGHDVDVLGVFDVAFTELIRGADVDDGDFPISDEFGGRGGIDVFDFVFREGGGGEGNHGGEEEGEAGHGDGWLRGELDQGELVRTSTSMRASL